MAESTPETKPPHSKYSRAQRDRRRIDPDAKVLHKILLALDPEGDTPAVSTMWLPTLVDADEKYVRQTACDAACLPYEYTGRRDYWLKASIVWRMPEGCQLLIDKGYISEPGKARGDQLEHRVQDTHNFLSIRNGVPKYPLLEFINWDGIIRHPLTPAAIKRSLRPFDIVLPTGKKVKPDGRPFALRHREEGMLGVFKETDRGTEDTGGSAHVTYEKKAIDWITIFEKRLYDSIYGFPRAVVLFIFPSVNKEWVFHSVLERVRKGKPCPFILTQSVPDFEHSSFSVQPHTDLIDKPYHRFGCPDFSLTTFKDAQPLEDDPFHEYRRYQLQKIADRQRRKRR